MTYKVLAARDDGFFTNVFSVLGALDWCAGEGCQLAVRFDTGAYLDPSRGPNWWDYFFEPVSDADAMALPLDDRGAATTFSRFVADRVILDRARSAALIRAHLRLRPAVLEGVEHFWEQSVESRFAVGLHLRGTDKFVEQPRVDLDAVEGYVERLVHGRPPGSWRLFIASDEQSYLDWARGRFGAALVFQDAQRSADGHGLHKPVPAADWPHGPHATRPYPHYVAPPPYRIGLEALRDALYLARCDVFLAAQSCLSYFAAAWNPRMPMIEAGGILPPAWRSALPEMKEKDRHIRDILAIAEERARLVEHFHAVSLEQAATIERLSAEARTQAQSAAPPRRPWPLGRRWGK